MASSNGYDASVPDPDAFLDRIIDIDGDCFERLQPITDYRRDPGEARILYLCQDVASGGHSSARGHEAQYVMKVKVQ